LTIGRWGWSRMFSWWLRYGIRMHFMI